MLGLFTLNQMVLEKFMNMKDRKSPKKPWHPPKFEKLSFKDTLGGTTTGTPENATYS